MTLGQKIREARLERQLTQQEVVGDVITRNMLSRIENDAATPSVRTLEHLAAAMDLPPGYFLSDLSPTEMPDSQLRHLELLLERDDPQFLPQMQRFRDDWTVLGHSLSLLEARYHFQRGERDKAAALLADIDPDPASARYFAFCLLKGQLLSDIDTQQAESYLQRAEQIVDKQTPEDRSLLYSALETLHRERGDFREAYRYAKLGQSPGSAK